MATVVTMLSWLEPMWPNPATFRNAGRGAAMLAAVLPLRGLAGRCDDDSANLVGASVYLAAAAALDIGGVRSLLWPKSLRGSTGETARSQPPIRARVFRTPEVSSAREGYRGFQWIRSSRGLAKPSDPCYMPHLRFSR